jgi:hypothetical protein
LGNGVVNPYETYAKAAHSRVTAPQRLVGPIATRAEARRRYTDLTIILKCVGSTGELELFLAENVSELKQFETELEFFWEGDGFEVVGLRKEIERVRACFDAGLDLPRWEPSYLEAEKGIGI